jgi:hypothetical protein
VVSAVYLTLFLTDVLPPAPPLRRNRVIIEDWRDPEDDFNDFDGDDEDDNLPHVDGEDHDPLFFELDPGQGLNPEDEPALDDNELWEFLQAELGDLADDEWIDMCEYIIYITL